MQKMQSRVAIEREDVLKYVVDKITMTLCGKNADIQKVESRRWQGRSFCAKKLLATVLNNEYGIARVDI